MNRLKTRTRRSVAKITAFWVVALVFLSALGTTVAEMEPEKGRVVFAEGSVTRAPKVIEEGEPEGETASAQGAVTREPETQTVAAEGSVTRVPVPTTDNPIKQPPTNYPTQQPTIGTTKETGAPTELPSLAPAQKETRDADDAVPAASSKNVMEEGLVNETITFDDFENGNDHSWSPDQRVSESEMFTQFLGRFGQELDGSNAFTESTKTYTVPAHAAQIGVEFDFYELDLWCDCDRLTVMICGEAIDMGEFSQSGAANQEGVSNKGIGWYRHATSEDVDMGYSHFKDKTHHMRLDIPPSCYMDGTLEVKFNVTIDGDYDLASGGIDNVNITAYDIPPLESKSPSMAPTEVESEQPTVALNLDICVSDVTYDPDVGTVHKECFNMVSKMTVTVDGAPEEQVVGKACVQAIDNDNFQLEVKNVSPEWTFSKVSAWGGESLSEAPRIGSTVELDIEAFNTSRSWSDGDGAQWIATLPLLNTYEHCVTGLTEFTEILVVHIAGEGPDPVSENNTAVFQAFADEHYNQPGDFLWAHLVFSCHCNHDAVADPPPTVSPSTTPSMMIPSELPTASPSNSPIVSPTSQALTTEITKSGTETCIATTDGSGRECRPLVGHDGTLFGKVCIEMAKDENTGGTSNDMLNVTYTTDGDYRLTRNFVWLGNRAGDKVPTKSREGGELDDGMEEPDVDHFPHYACNFLGSRTWEKLIPIQPSSGTHQFFIVAHSEVAISETSGLVALGTVGTKAFGAEHTVGSVDDASWYEVIHFKVDWDCRYIRSSNRAISTYEPYVGVPTAAPSGSPVGTPTIVPTVEPTSSPTQRPTSGPTLGPSPSPSSSPSFHAPTPAPTHACRSVWAVEQGHAHCFRQNNDLGGQDAPYGWYNGIYHLDDVVTLDLFVEKDFPGAPCEHGQRVGTVDFRYASKIVTVEFETIADFYMTETQVHVGAEILPERETDRTYITDPNKFELVNNPSERTVDDHFLRGCQEDNWISARAVVCGPFNDDD